MTNEYINTILSGLRHCGSDEFCDNCPAEKLCATKPGEHICNRAAEIIEELRRKHGRWEPVRHGEWRRYPECGVTRCSVCDWSIEECFSSNYCPNCGARMDKEERDARKAD